MTAVVVAGDALIDMTPSTSITGHLAYEPHPGGSSLNVAVGLGRLGVPVALLARVSTDAFGALLREHLRDSGVLMDLVVETDDLTTLAAVHLRDGGQASYSFYANGTADRGLRPEQVRPLPDGAALHLGSIALVLEPTASTLEGLLLRESGRRLVSLDPNVRPGLIPDRGEYVARFDSWVPHVDVLKLSEEDLAWLHPDQSEDQVVADWMAAGVGLVLITRGGGGARATTATASARVDGLSVEVVDTVGAGDAFTAGALAHLHRQGQLTREAVRTLDGAALTELLGMASRVAALTCTRPGADPPRSVELR